MGKKEQYLIDEITKFAGVEKVEEVMAFVELFRPSAETVTYRTLLGGMVADITDVTMLLSAAATGGADAYREALSAVAPNLVAQVDAYLKEHPLAE